MKFDATESQSTVESPSQFLVGAEWVLLPTPVGGGAPDSARPPQRTAMKRFTETNKWRDPWFRKLTPTAKLLFQWLVENCDNAGVIDLDLEAASFDIGEAIKQKHVAEIESRLKRLPNGKFWLTKFIAFQYGTLSRSEKCVPHLRVIQSLQAHGITYPETPTLATTVVSTLGTRVDTTDKERRGQDKDKDKEGGEGGRNGELDPAFAKDLMAAYRRTSNKRLTFAEESTLAQIIREHPRYREEWDTIITLKQHEPRYFPQSLSRLLSSWQETLDRATNWVPVPSEKPIKTLFDKELERIKNMPIP